MTRSDRKIDPRGVSQGPAGTAHLETTDGGGSYRCQFTLHYNSHCDCGATNASLRAT